ncbi:MAG TPA: glycosyltransferase [Candidatus Acidoferrum sp.]
MVHSSFQQPRITAIVPARNEENVIAVCVASLTQQKEISEILVVDDQSSDATVEIVLGLAQKFPQVRLLEAQDLPAGWVGKNHAVWLGAVAAIGEWLLFTDADAVHDVCAAAKALEIARQFDAAMVSFSPEQLMLTWYEKALIPYVYCRLARLFSFAEVNDPRNIAAAANGQFLMIRRDAYDAVGGHSSIASAVLEDVALARRVKSAGYRIWFGSGQGIVRVRMYRSFSSMWQGWRKNLYLLVGGTPDAVRRELGAAILPVPLILLAAISTAGLTESILATLAVVLIGVVVALVAYDGELKRNGYPTRPALYGLVGRLMYAAVLWASYQSYRKGTVEWKGREYPVSTPEASNTGRNR